MGLGINIKGDILKSVNFASLRDCITANSERTLKPFISFHEVNQHELEATLHPCEEPVFFEMVSNDIIVCSAKTNTVGPGYHAYLVDLIEIVGEDLGIKWYWDLEEGDEYYQDETGYYATRDFRQLQFEMLRWLKALCNSNLGEREEHQFMIGFPVRFPRMSKDYFAVSPMGFWERDWFLRVADAQPEVLTWAGEQFFIWWDKEPNAKFFQRTGIALLNVECSWHIPGDEKETSILKKIDECFIQAKQMDEKIAVPTDDWDFIKGLLANEDPAIPSTNYGYRKNEMVFDLIKPWAIKLPGTMYRMWDENTLVFYDHIWTIRSSGYTIKKTTTDDEYLRNFFNNVESFKSANDVIDSSTSIAGKAYIYYYIDKEQDSEYWILSGVKLSGNEMLMSTICYPMSDYRDRAIEIWDSLRL